MVSPKKECKHYTVAKSGRDRCKILTELVCVYKKCTFFDLSDEEKEKKQIEEAEHQEDEENEE